MFHTAAVRRLTVVSLLATACVSGPQPTSPAPAAVTQNQPVAAKQEVVVGPPQVAWKDMTKPERGRYMKEVVNPEMKRHFVAFDPDEFSDFGCRTCHGSGVDDKSFKMPNSQIFVLPASPAGFQELSEKKGKWMEFMGGTVKPKMAALLGLEEFNPKSPKPGTVGCMACHTSKTE